MRSLFGVVMILAGVLMMAASFARADEATVNGSTTITDRSAVAATPMVKAKKKKKTKKTTKFESKKTVWVCPMGDFTSDKPGKCPNCGMDLVEKK